MKITVFTTYTTTSGVYYIWAYRKRHVFKNIFKLPIPSYTLYFSQTPLHNSDDQSDSDHGVYLLSNIRTKLQFIKFLISFTNICHLYMFTQILPVNKIDRMQRNWRKTEVAHVVYVQPVVPGVCTLRFSYNYLCEMLT